MTKSSRNIDLEKQLFYGHCQHIFGAMNTMATSLLRNLSTGLVGATIIGLGTTVAAPSYAVTLVDLDRTFGDDMAGMLVTVDFLDGGSETATWEATGPDAGGAFGTGWSVTQSGDTFFDPWAFTNTGEGIASLVINANPGNTAFDTIDTIEEPPSTPGSANGIPFTVLSGPAPDSFAYSDEVDISEGDLFGTLALNYDDGFTGTTTVTYRADTDNLISVPESSSGLGLLAVGAFGVGSLLKRRQQ